jgi:type I restriction enzyme S subunit
LSGKYLNALFHSEYAKKYFANAAGGSGQRYTLTLDAIENFPVPAISLTEQIKIGTCLNNIDQQIQRNNDMVHKLRFNDTTISCFSMKGEMRYVA